MNPNRRFNALLSRLGQEAEILSREQIGYNELNNPEHAWTPDRTVKCVRTYPNRNTQVESPGGRYNRDRPVFLFERSEAPDEGVRIDYDGQRYELKSPTLYDTHCAIFGEKVSE